MHESRSQRPSSLLLVALSSLVVLAGVSGIMMATSTSADDSPEPRTLEIAEAAVSESPARASQPVVVEMFTSQGCSSCPPADRNLARLGAGEIGGAGVIPLAFHVDYWNYIGWTDPFSDERWSQRQERYAEALGSRRIYTPQAVIQGRHDCVGSKVKCLEAAIDEERTRPRVATLVGQISFESGSESDPDGTEMIVRLGARIEAGIDESSAPRAAVPRLQVWAVLYERDLSTRVGAGENSRRTLVNDYVVRHFRSAFEIAATPGAEQEGSVRIPLPARWEKRRLGFAAVVQDPDTMHIHGAWAADLADASAPSRP